MGSLSDPGELTQPSFNEFQKQTSLMTSCTLLWKELSDYFNSLEQDLRKKSNDIKQKIQTLDHESKESLGELENREVTIDRSVQITLEKLEQHKEAALLTLNKKRSDEDAQVDDNEGLLFNLRNYCFKMDSEGFWRFVTVRKKELNELRVQVPVALAECIDPTRFVLEAISEVFSVDKRIENVKTCIRFCSIW